jgi:DDE superfamily endonuclease
VVANGQFVATMEHVLDVYKRPYNRDNPVVCMDETSKQLIRETRKGEPMKKGKDARVDYEYFRCGVCNIFMANEPLVGKRYAAISEQRTKKDWAKFIQQLSDIHYPHVSKITLVMDNLNTHNAGSFYEAFEPEQAKRLMNRFDFVYTPKHGSWLNMAEIELNVLSGQCLNRHIDNITAVKEEVSAWQKNRNGKKNKIDWQFTTSDARIKLKKLYPSIYV